MSTIKLLREPGFVYDLNFIFYLKFNMDDCINALKEHENIAEITKYYQSVSEQYGAIPDELQIFFRALKNGRTFFTKQYISVYKNLFPTNYSFSFLLEELADKDTLVEKMIRFYLHKLSEEELTACIASPAELYKQIKVSDYSGDDKSLLYEFFLDPDPYIETLRSALTEKAALLTAYYEKNYHKIIDAYNNTSFETLSNQLDGVNDLSFLESDGQTRYSTYCLTNKYGMQFFMIPDGIVFLLGSDYQDILDIAKNNIKEPDLQHFGHALSDEGRVRILQLLLERGEIVRKDLELLFSFSGSTAYHHITIMTNAGLIKTRSRRKTIIYSLNREYFDRVIEALRKYSTEE